LGVVFPPHLKQYFAASALRILVPTANEHHDDGEDLFGRRVRRNVAKSHGSETGEGEVEGRGIRFRRGQNGNGSVLSFRQKLQPTCEEYLRHLIRREEETEKKTCLVRRLIINKKHQQLYTIKLAKDSSERN